MNRRIIELSNNARNNRIQSITLNHGMTNEKNVMDQLFPGNQLFEMIICQSPINKRA